MCCENTSNFFPRITVELNITVNQINIQVATADMSFKVFMGDIWFMIPYIFTCTSNRFGRMFLTFDRSSKVLRIPDNDNINFRNWNCEHYACL